MRITKLRLQNLNSLYGEWSIDFTHPRYAEDGIFAITGPTGAGKTTLLDALCLALYGETPRLGKITEKQNDLMSRHSAECFAEVEFSTQTEKYRCHWSQRRARKKADGKLQAPKRELASLDGKILAEKNTQVAQEIEKITGMDFQRFTRSMLLAQGQFASFLQAAADERAPILEQITGTAIYSQISMRVHERKRAEEEQLKLLRGQFDSVKLMDNTELNQLQAQISAILSEQAQLEKSHVQYSAELNTLLKVEELSAQIENLDKAKSDWQQENASFEDSRKKLHLALAALELSADYQHLCSQRHKSHTLKTTQAELQASTPVLETKLAEIREQIKALETEQQSRQQELIEAKPRIHEARSLEGQLSQQGSQIAQYQQQLNKLENEKNQEQDSLATLKKKLNSTKEQESALLRTLEKTAQDQSLEQNFNAIKQAVEHLSHMQNEQQGLRQQIAQQETELSQAQKQYTDAQKLHSRLANDVETLNNKFEKIKSEWQDKAQEIPLEQRFEDIHKINDQLGETHRTIAQLERFINKQESTQALINQIDDLKVQLTKTEAHHQTQLTTIEQLAKDLKLAQTEYQLSLKTQELETLRAQLNEGEACPLCGALEHPFKTQELVTSNESEDKLKQIQVLFDHEQAQGLLTQQECTRIRTKLEELQLQYESIKNALAEEWAELLATDAAKHCSIDKPSPQALLEHIHQHEEELMNSFKQQQQAYNHLKLLRKSLDQAEKELREADQENQKNTAVQREAHYQVKNIQALLEKEQQRLIQSTEGYSNSQHKLNELLAPYQIDYREDSSDSNRLLPKLKSRQEQWQQNSAQKLKLEKQASELNQQILSTERQLQRNNTDITEQHRLIKDAEQKQQVFSERKKALLGGESPDELETRLQRQLQQAERKLQTCQIQRQEMEVQLSEQTKRLQQLDGELEQTLSILNNTECTFAKSLAAKGFESEILFLDSKLDEINRQQLLEIDQKLIREGHRIQQSLTQAQELFEQTKQEQPDESKEVITSKLTAIKQQREQLSENLGSLRQQLTSDQKARQALAEKATLIEQQQEELERWSQLHELIGSADGKKFRTFAQGLTFQHMVRLANYQLNKMSDRYQLVMDPDTPLSLHVIDQYQAGESRTTKNLSGGESFIVSLALALGLSQMASQKVRVDSLFLDEGFGTLDEDALDIALDTLSNLQQEGKLIGIISHVSALKERISTQIKVHPVRAGKSAISGPGCKP